MTGLQKAVEHEQASTFEDQKQSQTGFPFKKIVYVGDLSGEPSYGLRYTQKLAHERHAELVLVHSLDPIVYALPGAELQDGAAKAELTAMEHDPRAPRRQPRFPGAARANLRGDPGRGEAPFRISAYSQHRGTNRPPAAWRSRPWRGFCWRIRPCSILTIPTPAESAALPRWMWQNVIAATDFSDAGIAALDVAQRIAGRGLVVLHSTPCGKEQECSHCMTRLRLLAPFNESHTLPVEHLVASGAVTTAIASVARRVHPDLLVLGAPPVAIDSGHLDDSTIYRAITESHCPVLLVPPGTGRGDGTIDKAVYEWLDKVRCVDGQPPVQTNS